ncbi:hypothetical protein [Salinibacter ruber]|mgnify:CR=1 FL=1|jgi:hypothetical protein|uniref:hypothetical protein n=1 Tax=Salinibacter ruber TaxID=146919 RepID=UPI002072D82B|nr:hypothetical protein [Salinibacter ruber]
MSKNRLSQLESKKQKSEQEAREKAEEKLRGEDPWEEEKKTDRVSMRVEPSLKEKFEDQLPRFASISDAIREYMIRVARRESEV